MTDKVRDLRRKEKFVIDDDYLNGYARVCGIFATGVYIAICRHANKLQTAFPSIELMAKKLKISDSSSKRGVKKLEEFNIIKVTRKKNNKGRHTVNTYTLLDKSVWKPIHRSEKHTEKTCPQVTQTKTRGQTDQNQRSEGADKVTHIKDTHIREGESKKPLSCPFIEIVNLYHEVLPELSSVAKLNEARKRQINARWNESKKWQSLDKWREYFEHIRESPFLMGKVNISGRYFKADLEWITRESNFINIIEGKYHAD